MPKDIATSFKDYYQGPGFSESMFSLFLRKVPQVVDGVARYIVIGGWPAELLIRQNDPDYKRPHRDLDVLVWHDILNLGDLPVDVYLPEGIQHFYGVNTYQYDSITIKTVLNNQEQEVVIAPPRFLIDCFSSGDRRYSEIYENEEIILKDLYELGLI